MHSHCLLDWALGMMVAQWHLHHDRGFGLRMCRASRKLQKMTDPEDCKLASALQERQFKSQDSIMARCPVCRCSYHPSVVTRNEMLTSCEVGSSTRWYGPSGCVRRLRRLLEEESAVRMLVGGGQFLYQGHQRCFNDGDLVFEPVGFLDQCWRVLRLNTNEESEDSLPFYESGIRS